MIKDEESTSGIRIGSNVAFGALYRPAVLSDFCKKYPDIPIFTRIENSSRMEVGSVPHNELDFAIVDAPANAVLFPKLYAAVYRGDAPGRTALPAKALANLGKGGNQFKRGHPPSQYAPAGGRQRQPQYHTENVHADRRKTDDHLRERQHQGTDLSLSSRTGCSAAARSSLATPYPGVRTASPPRVEDFNMSRSFVSVIYHQSKYLTKSMQYFLDEMAQTDLSAIPVDSDFS